MIIKIITYLCKKMVEDSNKMKNNKYHTVGTAPISNRNTTNTTLSEQLQYLTEKQQIPHCRNSSNI